MTALLVQFTRVLEKSDKVITKPNGFFILAPDKNRGSILQTGLIVLQYINRHR